MESKGKRNLFPYFYLLPVFIWVFFRFIYPGLEAVALTAYDVRLAGSVVYDFIGFNNWLAAFSDPNFWICFTNTVIFVIADLTLAFGLALVFAVALNTDFKGSGILKAALIIPWAIPNVSNALMWQWIFNGQYGIANAILFKLKMISDYINWLVVPQYALMIVILVQVWKDIPFLTLEY